MAILVVWHCVSDCSDQSTLPTGFDWGSQQLVTDSLVDSWGQNTMKWSKREVLSMASNAKNIAPMSPAMISTLQILTGRDDLLPWTSQLDAPQQQVENSKLPWNQLVMKRQKEMQQMRTNMIAPIAQKILKMAVTDILRARASETPPYGDRVRMWDSNTRCSIGVFRFLFSSGRNGLVERGSVIKKLPIQRIR